VPGRPVCLERKKNKRGPAVDDDLFQIPNYPDMIVIPFRIPWASASTARARRARQQPRDRVPAMGWAGASPSDRPDDFEPPDPPAVRAFPGGLESVDGGFRRGCFV